MNEDLDPTQPTFSEPLGAPAGTPSAPSSLPPSKFGQRMAEASWIACGLSILIGFFARMLNPESPGAIRAIALSNDALIIAGFVCAVVALVGNRWWKNRDIVR